jgi:hypothetical protein
LRSSIAGQGSTLATKWRRCSGAGALLDCVEIERAPSGGARRQVDDGVSLLAGVDAAGAAAGALDPLSLEVVLAAAVLVDPLLPLVSPLLPVAALFDVDA